MDIDFTMEELIALQKLRINSDLRTPRHILDQVVVTEETLDIAEELLDRMAKQFGHYCSGDLFMES